MLIRINNSTFGHIYDDYHTLYEMSRTARYNCHSPNSHDYVSCDTHLANIKTEFKRITSAQKTE
jgi:hypothetical protein